VDLSLNLGFDAACSLKMLVKHFSFSAFPNAEIAYTIMLTVPVTVARGERSYSKLKMIKNFLRTTVVQERLGRLAVLPIEKDDIDYSNFFAESAASKSRKVVFLLAGR